jgi:hypothetical protein
MIDKRLIDEIIRENNQFPATSSQSALWRHIARAYEVSDAKAQELTKTHCNSLAIYALFRARGFYTEPYASWLRKFKNVIRQDGFVSVLAEKLAKDCGLADYKNIGNKYFENYDDVMSGACLNPDKGYKIKVVNISGTGSHFMAGYVEDDGLYLSDSSSRGIRVRAGAVIPRNKFKWVGEI